MRRKRSGIDAQPALGAVGNQRVMERIEGGKALDAQNQDGVVRLAEIVGNLQRKRRGGKSGGVLLQDALCVAQPFGRDFAQKSKRDMVVGNLGIASGYERFALTGDVAGFPQNEIGQGQTVKQSHGGRPPFAPL